MTFRDYQPGDHEAAGAVAGMRYAYGTPAPDGLHIGQRCAWHRPNGETTREVIVMGKCGSDVIVAERIPGKGRAHHTVPAIQLEPVVR